MIYLLVFFIIICVDQYQYICNNKKRETTKLETIYYMRTHFVTRVTPNNRGDGCYVSYISTIKPAELK